LMRIGTTPDGVDRCAPWFTIGYRDTETDALNRPHDSKNVVFQ
jgi:hypothetical protein